MSEPSTRGESASGLRRVTAEPDDAGQRLDRVLAARLGELSRTRLKQLVEDGRVSLDGAVVTEPSMRVKAGQSFVLALPEAVADTPVPQAMDLTILYEDAHLLVLDKPAGLVVHPAPGNPDRTLVNALLAHCGASLAGIGGVKRPGIVHRLDKDTSGLMVVGRTLAAVANLQKQMQSRSTEKRYLLLVRGSLDEDEGLIDRPIGRDPRNRQRMAIRHEGRSAQTQFWVRERYSGWSLLEARLLTGRTHQLRVHFASIGHPIAGDATYGRGALLPGLARQFLHSHVLRLRSPHDEREHTFTSDLPAELSAVLRRLRR
jgi:23S rRNA pseudouridine1911/1915/1917 synthase